MVACKPLNRGVISQPSKIEVPIACEFTKRRSTRRRLPGGIHQQASDRRRPPEGIRPDRLYDPWNYVAEAAFTMLDKHVTK